MDSKNITAPCVHSEPIYFRGTPYRTNKVHWCGTHRAISPDETLQRISPVFRDVGITRVSNITGLDRIGIPTTLAIRPNAKSLCVSSGKGFSLVSAVVSGAMEAIELFHAENVAIESFSGTYNEMMRDSEVIPLSLLPLTKDSLFTPDSRYSWVFGWDLIRQVEIAVPLSMVEMVRNSRRRTEMGAFQVSSNGLASGNTFLEAVAAALYEVVERDATTCHRVRWDICDTPPPVVDLKSVSQPNASELIRRLQAAEIGVQLFDCTTDTAIPVFMCFIFDIATRHVGAHRGYGCHLDPEIAMLRAITEAVQSRLVFIAGSRDDFFKQSFSWMKRADSLSTIKTLMSLPATVDVGHLESHASDTFEADISLILKRLCNAGLQEAVILDLSVPDFPAKVVRAIVPGLEGYIFDFYAPGPRARAFSGQQE